MTLRSGLLGAMCGLLCGCGNLPEPYAPPTQRPFFEAPPEAPRILNMADDGAESHFIQDISAELEGNTWRWTGKRPTIRLNSNQKLVYSIDFAIVESTFQQTGPVSLSLFVNDHLLDRVRYTSPGRRRVEKPVPAEWLEPDQNATLAAEIDKVWTPPQAGGKPLGFVLVALGLEQQGIEQLGLEKQSADRK
jgi:hypothetical protein